jgi:hypothetical protein
MSMNLVAIAGPPPFDPMGGKLLGVPGFGGCGCGMGDVAPTDEQKSALNWAALGFFGMALVIGYFVLREPERGHR